MNLVSKIQLAQLRLINVRSMMDQVTILTPNAITPDGYGGTKQTFMDGVTVACRIRPYTQRADSVQGAEGGNEELFLFALPFNTTIDVQYRLRRAGIEYEVVGDLTSSTYQLSRHVLAKKV
jgi:hypothetical protein